MSAPEARTRDVWIISDGEVPPHRSLWQPTIETARVQRSQRVIQSRVADDLFWLGRYGERTDWIMRVLRSALQRLQEDYGPSDGHGAARTCLRALLLREEIPGVAAPGETNAAAIERLARLLISARKGKRTLDATLDKLYRVSSLTRDRLSLEGWRVLSHFRPGEDWRRAIVSAPPEVALDLIEDGLGWLAAFNGLMHENMTRNYGWAFLDMGRRLERAYNLSEAILSLFGQRSTARRRRTGSSSCSSSRTASSPTAPAIASTRCCHWCSTCCCSTRAIPAASPTSSPASRAISHHCRSRSQGASLTEERRLILSMLTSVRLADVESFAEDATRAELQAAMRNQLHLLPQLTTAIERRYFNLIEEQPHRVHTRLDPRQ